MKPTLILLALSLSSVCAQTREQLIDAILIQQNAERTSYGQAPIYYVNPNPVPLSIYSAYPNNPALYRYLERNPRMIPYYLGQ